MDFYLTLENIMNEQSLSIPDVAKLCGLSDSTIRSIINRRSKGVALDVAFKISEGLKVSLERLNSDDDGYHSEAVIAATHDFLAVTAEREQGKLILSTDEYPVIAKYRRLNDSGKKYIDAQLDFAFMQEQYQADPKKLPHMPDMKGIQADAEAFVEQLKKQHPPTKN